MEYKLLQPLFPSLVVYVIKSVTYSVSEILFLPKFLPLHRGGIQFITALMVAQACKNWLATQWTKYNAFIWWVCVHLYVFPLKSAKHFRKLTYSGRWWVSTVGLEGDIVPKYHSDNSVLVRPFRWLDDIHPEWHLPSVSRYSNHIYIILPWQFLRVHYLDTVAHPGEHLTLSQWDIVCRNKLNPHISTWPCLRSITLNKKRWVKWSGSYHKYFSHLSIVSIYKAKASLMTNICVYKGINDRLESYQ